MMGRKQKLIDGYELDVVYNKSIYCYLNRSKVAKKIKRRMNKRMRREERAQINASLY
jgi:hypothetical protein